MTTSDKPALSSLPQAGVSEELARFKAMAEERRKVACEFRAERDEALDWASGWHRICQADRKSVV